MKLKKIFLLALLSALFFVACNKEVQVSEFQFRLNDGDIPAQYYSEVDMKIVPDYQERLLTVQYDRVFPKRTAETLEEDVKIAGATLGGENFEKFLEIVNFLEKSESEILGLDEKKSVFLAKYIDLKGDVKEFRVNWDNDDADYEALKNFYLNIANLLTENEPV